MRRLATAWLGLLLTACTVGPDYQRPDVAMPARYLGDAGNGGSIANLGWWDLFEDPALRALVTAALAENRDLAAAAARVDEARAQAGFVRADQFPRLDARGSVSRQDGGSFTPDPGRVDNYVLAAELSYEVDIWGRLRRSTEAARAELLATEEAQRAVTLALVADVATTYLTLRDLDAQRQITERTLASRQESLTIIQARFDQGTVPLLDVNQAEIEAAEAAASLARIERDIAQTENLLNLLLGRNPGPVIRGAGPALTALAPGVPAGLPAELLARRPDIRQAEQALAAQTARIGAAQALRLPTISLTGSLGLASDELAEFTSSDAGGWGLGATLFGPLFDWGKSKRRVEVEQARTRVLLAGYEQAVLRGLREVEDALVAVRTLRAELAARERQVAAARSAATLSRARYDGGVTSYLEVLDSERSLFQAELSTSATRRARQVAVVNLYKALGGGW